MLDGLLGKQTFNIIIMLMHITTSPCWVWQRNLDPRWFLQNTGSQPRSWRTCRLHSLMFSSSNTPLSPNITSLAPPFCSTPAQESPRGTIYPAQVLRWLFITFTAPLLHCVVFTHMDVLHRALWQSADGISGAGGRFFSSRLKGSWFHPDLRVSSRISSFFHRGYTMKRLKSLAG